MVFDASFNRKNNVSVGGPVPVCPNLAQPQDGFYLAPIYSRNIGKPDEFRVAKSLEAPFDILGVETDTGCYLMVETKILEVENASYSTTVRPDAIS